MQIVDPGLLTLSATGVDEPANRLYLLAVHRPGITRAALLAEGFDEATIEKVTADLQRIGLLRRTADDEWEALPPDLTLPALAGEFELRAATARALSIELSTIYRNARAHPRVEGGGIVALSNQQELAEASAHLVAVAEHEVIGFRDNSPRTAHLFGGDPDQHRGRWVNASGRPLRLRTTFDSAVLDLPRAAEILQARTASGESCRFARGLPFSVIVADTTSAVVDLTSYDSSAQGCLLVGDRRLVLALAGLVEMVWRTAAPMASDKEGPIDGQSRLILSLLAAGATDTLIASRTGISQRTVERKVRTLMERLGAATRFQAGVQAARRGWL
ncbi:putative LuxR family transcriptional regulator [Kineosphaera limosa NBRC 100340]|uniref:Putative LuxR family transcriptional regulator n=1 Tax=Kineosphaera limosa NBRC 100340 TaxID=1184609 RepID=K6X9R1_9MICO|nr:putative LuxR family transcriptional regulator [Kineosphaera limosa NBRC 100340]